VQIKVRQSEIELSLAIGIALTVVEYCTYPFVFLLIGLSVPTVR
jgi:hypothetical protein